MGTWIARAQTPRLPDEVMGMLTSPDAIARWAPVPFELVDFDHDRLHSGDTLRVCGVLAGRSLEFDVEVSGRGVMGRVLARATDALLAAGALNSAVGRIAHELQPPVLTV
jgi:hypothetical protein